MMYMLLLILYSSNDFISFHCTSDETLEDPALRQAYDYFGHSAVAIVRHNRYAADSLYRGLSELHDDGKASEALEVLQIVLEDRKQMQRQKEWEWNADVEVNMHTCSPQEDSGALEWPVEVSSTNVSLMASVPMPPQTGAASPFPAQSSGNNQPRMAAQKQKMQLSIGGSSNLKNGMGSTCGMLSANYQPVQYTNISSDLAIGRKHLETSISSSTQLSNGTGLSAKVTRQYELGSGKDGTLGFGFSSNRSLSMFHGRTVNAMFALGTGANLKMQYGIFSLTTWGFSTADQDESSDRPPPRITAKLTGGSQFPVGCSIDQSHLFGSPHRSGRASLAWSPAQGYKLKGMLSRKLSKRCIHHESEFVSTLGIGVEHSGLSGLKWLIQYQRPEGLTVRIPIFMSNILSPIYMSRVVWVSALSFLLDETIEELTGQSSSELADSKRPNTHKTISTEIRTNQKERQWMNSSKAKQIAEQQLSFMKPVANMKRQHEESINGLVILKATYASVAPLSSGASSSISLDVTQQLQFWVENSRLYLPPASKGLLLGFYALTREHHNPDQIPMQQKKTNEDTGKHESSLSDFSHRLICLINDWLSRLGVGEEDGPHQGQYDQNEEGSRCYNKGTAAVTLAVRYKFKGGVYEIRIGDAYELELPSNFAINLGSSDLVS